MAQGIGGYLMDAAQTFGDNLMGIFDRMGELTMGAVGIAAGAIGARAPLADMGAAAALASPVGAGQGISNVIAFASAAESPVQAVKNNDISMEWADASRGDILGNLPRPITPAMDIPQRGIGFARAM